MTRDLRRKVKLDLYHGKATDFLRGLPRDFPLCYFGGSGRFEFLATAFSEVAPDEVLNQICGPQNIYAYNDAPFKTGYVGLIPYGDLRDIPLTQRPAIRTYRVNESLVWDHLLRETYRYGERDGGDTYILREEFMAGKRMQSANIKDSDLGLALIPESDKKAYLALVQEALEDIHSGRYYQINLLRYFKIDGTIERAALARRIGYFGGPFSLLFQFPDYTVASLSPERFLEIHPDSNGSKILTQPIKGTAGRHNDAHSDSRAASLLQDSAKDNAELHIIVDLMRNDLNRICARGSVAVSSAGKVVTFETVHHLVAEVIGRLRPNLSLKDIFSQVLPGGSITGAPKTEVMAAIREYEDRPRGFFMGTGFYLDDSGHFDSSILIRTLLGDAHGNFTYAAGSGIVIDSDPVSEFKEIADKCRVVTEPLPAIQAI